jgi:pyruvate dehydrogenase E2 component (dihydrolipoamide acetyltransferase)
MAIVALQGEKVEKTEIAAVGAGLKPDPTTEPAVDSVGAGFKPAPTGIPVESVKASPAAKRLAQEHGIDLTQIRGSGPGGRIVEEDVQRAVGTGLKPAPAESLKPAPTEGLKPVEVGVGFKPAPTRIKASPLAKRLAKEYSLDLSQIRGSGPEGRIIRADVLRAVEVGAGFKPTPTQPAAQPTAPPAPPITQIEPVSPVAERVMPLAGIRAVIADRTSQSIRTTARVTLIMEVDATNLVQMRTRLKERFQNEGVSISYTDLLIKIAACALKKHPIINSALMCDGIHIFESVNIGVAVALEDGLIVPVIKNADKKGLIELHKELRALAEKARSGKISLDELSGSTFTITNLGTYGVEFFTPVINPPECAILGLGKIAPKPVVYNGQICAREMMGLSLSFDHRITDGAPAAEFLQTMSALIQEPYMLIA